MNKNDKQQLVGGVTMFKVYRGKTSWFLVKQTDESEWELPKTIVRRGESSVRSVIRLMGEQAMVTAKVLEETGRTASVIKLNGKPVGQRIIYYLMAFKDASEILAFSSYQWLDFAKASKKLALKKEVQVLTNARDVLKEWDRTKGKKLA
ncbi:MAG: NUDIX domain-containing protein [Patescibacteria group bacterium]